MISRFLFPIIPLALVTGPFLADSFLSIIAFNFLLIKIKEKNFDFIKNNLIIIFIFFYGYILIRSLFAIDILLSLESSLFYFRYLFFVCGSLLIIKQYPQFLKYLLYGLIISILFVTIVGLIQIFFNFNIIGDDSLRTDRLVLFEDELILGSYLSRMVMITLPLSLYFLPYFKKYQVTLIYLLIIISVILILFSGERAALFLFILFIISFLILSRYKFYLKFSILLSLLTILFITFFTQPDLKTRMIDQTLSEMKDSENKYFIFTEIHNGHITSAFNMFLDNKIFGHGTKTFRLLCDSEKYINKFSCSTHPHNTYIQLLAETGIIGFGFIFGLFLIILSILIKIFMSNLSSRIFNNTNYKNFQICILITVFISLWPFTSTNSFFNNWISVIYYLPIPILIYFLKDKFYITKSLYHKI